jgi:hypothetical protein
MTLPVAVAIISLVIFIAIPGLIIWLVVRAVRRGSIRFLKPDEIEARQSKREAELHKAEEEWSLPPELNLPPPRPIRKTHLGMRLLGSLWLLPFLIIMMYFIYTFGFVFLHGGRPTPLPVTFHAFLDFLRAPYWQGWMLWPSVIFWGSAGLIVFGAHSGRRKQQSKQQKLLRWGKPACAAITSVMAGGQHSSTIWTLQYRDAAGNLVKASLTRPNMPIGSKRGPVLTVLYDPDNPSLCIGYPVWGYEIRVPEIS